MARIFLAVLAAALLVGPALADTHNHDTHNHAEARHIVETGNLRLIHGWAAEGADPMLVFMDIENHGDRPMTLVRASSDWAGFDLVAPKMAGNSGDLVVLDSLPIPAHSTMSLTPGAVALRARDLTETPAQGHVEHITLHFADGTQAEMDIGVQPPGTTRHPHAGHSH